ncbi:MAG: S-adenosylmethionine:tRNA ribosyltransferase-isomerase [Bacteroidetes bacterium]|nr:S-adenosylmethionine:tRNA ribosyltransferase-isomerase [Bacteroidota bacterium]
MIDPGKININDFDYLLSDTQIASFPLPNRDASKLLVLDKDNYSTHIFNELPDLLPENSLLVFNNTKVIHARLLFKKHTGSTIEIFCLEPAASGTDIQLAFQQKGSSDWKCFVGNNKRWKDILIEKQFIYNDITYTLTAERKQAIDNAWIISFSWDNTELSFAEVLDNLGVIPLPPYLNREAVEEDNTRYQTIYAVQDGSVAAPTAGLHFTDETFKRLDSRGIQYENITLHVGAGTFKPVSSETIDQHSMHYERIFVKRIFIEKLLISLQKNIIPVGTTTTRTLESLYWFGVKLYLGEKHEELNISQWDAYQEKYDKNIPAEKALQSILDFMNVHKIQVLCGQTQMMILPGYKFKIAKGIITNFHQPKSTLLLLIAAFIGDKWKEIYQYALNNNYRFLSYGDSCLLYP